MAVTNSFLVELICICCASGISTAVVVSHGGEEGAIYVRDGELVHAECGGLEGEEALAEIISWEYCMFETQGYPPGVTPTISRSWLEILAPHAAGADSACVKAPERRLKVLVVDDSAMMRRAISDIVAAEPDMEVAASAKNGEEALARIKELAPDIITLDVNMPVMDGSTAIKHIMIRKPCPVVIISNTDRKAVGNIMDFLILVAVDFVAKPARSGKVTRQAERIAGKIRAAAAADTRLMTRFKTPAPLPAPAERDEPREPALSPALLLSGPGGHAEWFKLVTGLPADFPGCLVVLQGMPAEFSEALAEFTAARSRAPVRPLSGETPLVSGACYIGALEAPPSVRNRRGGLVLAAGDPAPAADPQKALNELVEGLSGAASGPVLAAILSGAGGAGLAPGLSRLRERGGRVILQKIDTCMVGGPPAEIRDLGLADLEVKGEALAGAVMEHAAGRAGSGPEDAAELDWLI